MPTPGTVCDWYRDARLALSQCEPGADRLSGSGAPIDRDQLMEAVRLYKQLVTLVEQSQY